MHVSIMWTSFVFVKCQWQEYINGGKIMTYLTLKLVIILQMVEIDCCFVITYLRARFPVGLHVISA